MVLVISMMYFELHGQQSLTASYTTALYVSGLARAQSSASCSADTMLVHWYYLISTDAGAPSGTPVSALKVDLCMGSSGWGVGGPVGMPVQGGGWAWEAAIRLHPRPQPQATQSHFGPYSLLGSEPMIHRRRSQEHIGEAPVALEAASDAVQACRSACSSAS